MNTQQLESFVQVSENLNFARLQSASLKLQNHTNSSIQILSIACSNEANLIYLTDILARCRQRLPQLHPFLRIIPHRSLLNLFIHGEIDILFGFQDDIPGRNGFVYKELAQIPVCCAFRKDHPFAARKEIAEQELHSEKLIVCNSFEIPSGVASIQNRLNHQFLPDSTYYCENLLVMLTLVRAGYGFCLLPNGTSVDSEITYVPLAGANPMSYGVFCKDAAQNPLVRGFLSLL